MSISITMYCKKPEKNKENLISQLYNLFHQKFFLKTLNSSILKYRTCFIESLTIEFFINNYFLLLNLSSSRDLQFNICSCGLSESHSTRRCALIMLIMFLYVTFVYYVFFMLEIDFPRKSHKERVANCIT